MIALFCMIAILSFALMAIWITQLEKIEANEKKKNSLKYKVKKFFKKAEEIEAPKYNKQQIIIFLISSILALCISITGAVMHGIALEETNETAINDESFFNDNATEESNKNNISKTDSEENNISKEQNILVEENTTNTKNNEILETKPDKNNSVSTITSKSTISLSNIPNYTGKPYVAINNNVPYFTDGELSTNSYEKYTNLDNLGRCGTAVANIGKDIMPTEDRGDIGSIKPTGWHTVKYDILSGKYLYNRCHLIGYQLSGENANVKNLITGTRYLNVEGMLPFENMVDDYVEETNNHVLYRVTPIFEGNNLLASGVLIEAKSVEDNGAGILFNVYCYNVQPGIKIDYSTGTSSLNTTTEQPKQETTTSAPAPKEEPKQEITQTNTSTQTYILNTNTKKFHHSSCGSASRISEKNKGTHTGSRDELISQGYSPCGNCDP